MNRVNGNCLLLVVVCMLFMALLCHCYCYPTHLYQFPSLLILRTHLLRTNEFIHSAHIGIDFSRINLEFKLKSTMDEKSNSNM